MQSGVQPMQFRRVACVALTLLFAATLTTASADDTKLKDDAQSAGHAMGAAVRDVGQGARKVGKAVGKAAQEGGREFRRAIKGESR